MNKVKRIVVSSLAMAALLLIAVNATAGVVTNVNIPVSGTVVNPCNGENVAFNGIAHFTATMTFDGAGGVHVAFHDNIHVTATGDQGNSYVGNEGRRRCLQCPLRAGTDLREYLQRNQHGISAQLRRACRFAHNSQPQWHHDGVF